MQFLFSFLFFVASLYAQELTITSDTDVNATIQKVLKQLQEHQRQKIIEKNVHPLKRDFGFLNGTSDEAKAVYYVLHNDAEAIQIILVSNSINLLKEANIPFGDARLSGSYSLVSSAIRLKNLALLKIIINSLDTEQLHSPYMQKMLYKSIDKDLTIYNYLLSKGIKPIYKASYGADILSWLCFYGDLEDIKKALLLGASFDLKRTTYLQYALQRKSYEIARYLIDNYDFDLDAVPFDNSYYKNYLFYLVMLESSSPANREFFRYFIEKMDKKSVQKYSSEFLKGVEEINPSFYTFAMEVINNKL